MSRRQRGEGSVFQRASDGLWVGRVDLGWANGKRRRKTVYGQTQREAVTKLHAARKAIELGDSTTRTSTLTQWLTQWLVEIVPNKPRMKPGTLTNYNSMVHKWLIPTIGNVRLDRLSPQHVRQVHKATLAGGLSPTTVGHIHRCLGTAMNDALREGLVVRNVVSLVPKPAADIHPRSPLALDEVRRFFAVIEGDRLASRWHTALLLGLRQGECLGLRWSMLDLDEGVADVAWQLQTVPYRHGCGRLKTSHWTCGKRADHCPERYLDLRPSLVHWPLVKQQVLQKPKSGKGRIVPLPQPLVASLRERRALYLVEREQYEVDHDLVWANLDGSPIGVKRDRLEWRAALLAAGITHTDLHSARHTTATLLLALGTPESVIMSILGHSDAITTRGYAHTDVSMQRLALGGVATAVGLDERDRPSKPV